LFEQVSCFLPVAEYRLETLGAKMAHVIENIGATIDIFGLLN
jgi:hypothetical protein